ncbi:MAG: metalloregulator ArsR/SmtB family transcription factor [Gammaproteobacteria bacterium]|nr:metalloregulator ArsR/SmtB family transcription factor [Gammaproteobacteria bacterium]
MTSLQTSVLATPAPAPAVALDAARLAQLHKALADTLRLQSLRLLKNESFGVLELCRLLDIRQSALSHHLKVLAKAELVAPRREGNSIFYRRAFIADDDALAELKRAAFEAVDGLEIPPAQALQLEALQQERSELSLSFFNKNAEQFRENQGLIVERDKYDSSLIDVLEGLGLAPTAKVVEVGPGEGQFLLELARRYGEVIAVDNSADMLERSRATVAGHDNVTFVHGEAADAKALLAGQADLVVFDMVLHHIATPAATFRDVAELLQPNGLLLVIELCSHDQDWVRSSCGDLWLGFEEGELDQWAASSGLQFEQSSNLALRNGFQIQMRLFRKPGVRSFIDAFSPHDQRANATTHN